MVCGIIITIYTLCCSLPHFCSVKKRYSIEKGRPGRRSKGALGASGHYRSGPAAVCDAGINTPCEMSCWLPVLMRWTTLLWGLYLLAYIDYRERLIPNF